MKTFHLTIARVTENLFDGEAQSVTLPGSEGTFEVLANHEPLISRLKKGEARVVAADGQKKTFPLQDEGLAEVSAGQATILL